MYFMIVLKMNVVVFFVHAVLSTRIDELEKRVQGVLEQINENRSSDQKMMITFEEKLSNKVHIAMLCSCVMCHRLQFYVIVMKVGLV